MSVADTGIAEITHRRIWRIAGPIVLSNATVPLLGAVDTGVVGQMGAAAPIGAVGLGAVILTTVYWALRLSAHGHLGPGRAGAGRGGHGGTLGHPVARAGRGRRWRGWR
jgi:MATE family multidrug resistance protein